MGMTTFTQYPTEGDICMNGIEDHKVRSLTIFPDLSSVQDFNTMGDSDSPVPNSWEFFDDA